MVHRSQYVLGGMPAAAGGASAVWGSGLLILNLGSSMQQVGQLLISVVASWNCQTVRALAARGSPHLPSLLLQLCNCLLWGADPQAALWPDVDSSSNIAGDGCNCAPGWTILHKMSHQKLNGDKLRA